MRFRSLPIAGTAVDVAGDINLVKKVCANSKKFSSAKDSQNAYGEYLSNTLFDKLVVIYVTVQLFSGPMRTRRKQWMRTV